MGGGGLKRTSDPADKSSLSDHGAEAEGQCGSQRQTQGKEEGHDGPSCLGLMLSYFPEGEAK